MSVTLRKTTSDMDIMHNYRYRFWGALSLHNALCIFQTPKNSPCISSMPEFWPYLIHTLYTPSGNQTWQSKIQWIVYSPSKSPFILDVQLSCLITGGKSYSYCLMLGFMILQHFMLWTPTYMEISLNIQYSVYLRMIIYMYDITILYLIWKPSTLPRSLRIVAFSGVGHDVPLEIVPQRSCRDGTTEGSFNPDHLEVSEVIGVYTHKSSILLGFPFLNHPFGVRLF